MSQYFGDQVVPRKIPRAQVYALFALNGPEELQPSNVNFREYRHTGGEYADGKVYRVIYIDVDDVVAGRHWAKVFGIGEEPARVRSRGDDAEILDYEWRGRWRGFIVELQAEVRPAEVTAAQLDDATRGQLQALVDAPGAVVSGE